MKGRGIISNREGHFAACGDEKRNNTVPRLHRVLLPYPKLPLEQLVATKHPMCLRNLNSCHPTVNENALTSFYLRDVDETLEGGHTTQSDTGTFLHGEVVGEFGEAGGGDYGVCGEGAFFEFALGLCRVF